MKNLDSNQQAPSSVCEYCPESYSCGAFMTALRILDSETSNQDDTYSRELYLELKKRLDDYRFNYPDSKHCCWLVGKRAIIIELTHEVNRLLADVRARKVQKVP